MAESSFEDRSCTSTDFSKFLNTSSQKQKSAIRLTRKEVTEAYSATGGKSTKKPSEQPLSSTLRTKTPNLFKAQKGTVLSPVEELRNSRANVKKKPEGKVHNFNPNRSSTPNLFASTQKRV